MTSAPRFYHSGSANLSGFTRSSQSVEGIEDRLRAWFAWVGLRFDPFALLDATLDPRLSDYLVGHAVFATVWGEWVSFVFAPAGGGKSALRVRTSQACWVGQETNHAFPISYSPPFLVWLHTHPSREEHLAAITEAGAIRLLLALAYHPDWAFRLDLASRQSLRQILDWNLPGSLDGYLEQCRETRSVSPLLETFDPTFILPDSPLESDLLRFCDWLSASDGTRLPRPAPDERWNQLVDLLINKLAFRSIYVLLDGIDGVLSTGNDPNNAVECVATMLPESAQWTERRVFLKGYFPEETRTPLFARFPDALAHAQTAVIKWDLVSLAEVIRRRLFVASEGAFSSLDALASPALRDVEMLLARAVRPLPREMLVLTRRVLWEHVSREGATGKIQPEDVDRAIAWYTTHQPVVAPIPAPIG